MDQLFVTSDGRLRERWRTAFAGARAVTQVAEATQLSLPSMHILWLDITGLDQACQQARLREAVGTGARVVVMTATPTEPEAFQILNGGAVGYCHAGAVPEQLREIALAVEHGGLWMPPELVRRLMALSRRVVSTPAPESPEMDSLTSRELMVAQRVARGASNREIAADLEISERTVKAHLSAIFDKLGVRDRVQLALAMNNIPTYATVN